MLIQASRLSRIVVVLLTLSACAPSGVVGPGGLRITGKSTPDARATVVQMAGEYVRLVNTENKEMLEGLILWDEFVRNSPGLLTPGQVYAQMRGNATRWTEENHPMIHLDLRALHVEENEARVTLQRINKADAPLVEIEFFWTGEAWLVVDDSVFGSDGIIAKFGS